ncbi:response regulator transcription factor [Elioraea sp.]|uniref:response regulator transcription factor n=1 Tax=Elioraea sp. TaxID=2185103 RepID=UPI0025C53DEC|nr:response regulator transcription factor [Elioraea sp.]
MNVLIVEDDPRVAGFLERGLRAEGYRIRLARNGADGLEQARSLAHESAETAQAAIVILDLNLPGMSGMDVLATLRAERNALPILVLTALGSTAARVAGLRGGADDYLAKPFAFEELLARIEALGRRGRDTRPTRPDSLRAGELELDRARCVARRAGTEIRLTARELAVLDLLISAPGRVFSRERILAAVWGASADPLTNIVDVYIRRLRAKIDDPFATPLIETVRGLGYRLEAAPAAGSNAPPGT